MMSSSYMFRKYTEGYKFTKPQENIDHFMYMNYLHKMKKNRRHRNKPQEYTDMI